MKRHMNEEPDFFNKYVSNKGIPNNHSQSIENTIPFKLFKQIQFLAEGFCDDTVIFPYKATLKDKEIAYIYVYFLFSNENLYNEYFNKQTFTDALSYINYTFKTIYNYSDEMLESMHSLQCKKLCSFLTIHQEYINTEDSKEKNLFEYTKLVISEFPNADFEDAASVGVIFAEFFSTVLSEIIKFKEETPTQKLNKNNVHSTNTVSESTMSKKYFSKENVLLILCIMALAASIAINVHQSSLNNMIYQKLSTLENSYEDLKGDYEDALAYRDYYKAQLYDRKYRN